MKCQTLEKLSFSVAVSTLLGEKKATIEKSFFFFFLYAQRTRLVLCSFTREKIRDGKQLDLLIRVYIYFVPSDPQSKRMAYLLGKWEGAPQPVFCRFSVKNLLGFIIFFLFLNVVIRKIPRGGIFISLFAGFRLILIFALTLENWCGTRMPIVFFFSVLGLHKTPFLQRRVIRIFDLCIIGFVFGVGK